MTPIPASLSAALSPKLSEANASPNRRPREIDIRGAPLPSWVRTTMGNPGVLPLLTLAATIRSVTLIRVAVLPAPRLLPSSGSPSLSGPNPSSASRNLLMEAYAPRYPSAPDPFAPNAGARFPSAPREEALCSSASFSSRSHCSKRVRSLGSFAFLAVAW